MHWYVDVLKKYAVFEGRASRAEFWMFTLFNFLVSVVLIIIDNVSGLNKATHDADPLYLLYTLAVLLPSLGVSVRRLHDTGRSGWAILIALIPLVGGIILLVWLASEGTPGPNEYGPDSREMPAEYA